MGFNLAFKGLKAKSPLLLLPGMFWYGTACLLMSQVNMVILLLILNFCRVLNVVCFLVGNSLASEFYMLTFRNTLSVLSS